MWQVLIFGVSIAVLVAVGRIVYVKSLDIWFPNYLRDMFRKRNLSETSEPAHVLFCFVDHYEPMWGDVDYATECRRVNTWCEEYRALASKHQDADGCFPKHSFFYPQEEYRKEHLDALTKLCAGGFGEIEIHLHHDNDTEAGLREKINGFVKTLDENHGAVPRDRHTNELGFAFIHGNWCLDNSRPDGRWCGINNEISVLADLGCYADFTLPSAPSRTQTAKVNSIYYATDDPDKPKSHNSGIDCMVGGQKSGDLMIIQGVLGLNWNSRKWNIFPRLENSDIRASMPPSESRVDHWISEAVHVKGKPDWRFVKIHTHGAQETDMQVLLGDSTDKMFSYLEEQYNDGKQYVLHYVSAREMFNIAKAAEAGKGGDPNTYRDYIMQPPVFKV